VNDLPAKRSPAALTRPYEDDQTVYSVLRSISRLGPWEPPETMQLVSLMGSIVLDYREADLPLGITELECQVYAGSIEIIVPPDVDVELTGSVFLGSVETKNEGRGRWRRKAREVLLGESPEEEAEDETERPLLAVHCTGAMGSIEVKRT